ncbi:hypothetical protein LINGRAHAP2_LOCUS8831 [Linum grandiflorum]
MPMLILSISCFSRPVTSSVYQPICEGVDKHGRRCNPDRLKLNASQEDIFKTFAYDAFDQGRGSYCVPFDFELENEEKLTVYSYFACNYGLDGLDERSCRRWDRTLYLPHAKRALYHLSYIPDQPNNPYY